MTTFLLVRHGDHSLGMDVLAGDRPGVGLSAAGHQQITRLSQHLLGQPVHAIYSSPLQRTLQTAAILSQALGKPVQELDALHEVEFGAWAGRSVQDLASDAHWQRWNAFRSGTPSPAGDLILRIQARVIPELLRLRDVHPDQTVVLVSHGDVIRSTIAYWLGVPIDLFIRIQIDVASVSAVSLYQDTARVKYVNRLC
jgi:broad specificity phosphatase PhoE